MTGRPRIGTAGERDGGIPTPSRPGWRRGPTTDGRALAERRRVAA